MPDRDPPALPPDSPDSEFDLRARAELSLAFDAPEPPAGLLHLQAARPMWKRRALQGGLAAAVLAIGLTFTVLALRPPPLVRSAIEHQHRERMLRGNFVSAAALLQKLGLDPQATIPGLPQLTRLCDLDGQLAYHLTTYFEHGGMVTVFALDQPLSMNWDSGWWNNVYWQVIPSRDGKPLVLVAEEKRALIVARPSFSRPA